MKSTGAVVVRISGEIAQVQNNSWREREAARQRANGIAGRPRYGPTAVIDAAWQGPPARWFIYLARTEEPIVEALVGNGGTSQRAMLLQIPTVRIKVPGSDPAVYAAQLYTSVPCKLRVDFVNPDGTVIASATSASTVGG